MREKMKEIISKYRFSWSVEIYRVSNKSYRQLMNRPLVIFFQSYIYHHKGDICDSWMTYLKILYSCLRRWKSTLKILNVHLTWKQSNGKKTAEVRDQVFLGSGIPASGNTPRIIGYLWKWHLLWRLGPVLGCSFWIRWHKLRRHLATWQKPLQIWQSPFAYSYKIIFSPVRVCFHDTSLSLSVSVLQL
jgi:hypothetical protein